ncbi:MAG: hypothetical protein WBQ25_02925 [Nitrososphaeraceae archaeon]
MATSHVNNCHQFNGCGTANSIKLREAKVVLANNNKCSLAGLEIRD